MKSIFLTGGSGFVGRNVISYFKHGYDFKIYTRGNIVDINQEIVIHLAGKAHDLKNVLNSKEYYQVNTEFTKQIFDAFLDSNAKTFITLSSVKAVADEIQGILTEENVPNPITHYGKSKLLAEQYIFSKSIPKGKRVYILRPCMIHGRGNKGNLNLLFKFVKLGVPWPLGKFSNKRSFCSIDNLLFVFNELIQNDLIPSGIYNLSDDTPLSTNEIVSLIAQSQCKTKKILNLPKGLILVIARLGDFFSLPLNSEKLNKLTNPYVVSNTKLLSAMGKHLPVSSKEGFVKTFNNFNSK